MHPPPKLIYEFGPFQLDPTEQVLLRDGKPLPLTPKVFQTLLVLVRNNGHTVKKDALMKEIWPDTFVEEGNLTVNIFALRKALGDGADGQNYIETVPRRGYRFVAPVREIEANGAALILEKHVRARIVTQEEEILSPGPNVAEAGWPDPSAGALPDRRAVPSWAIGLAAVVVLGVILAGYLALRSQQFQPPPTSNRILLAVLPLSNLSGDPEQEYLSDGMTEEMITELARLNPSQLGVIARASVMPYKYGRKGIRQIASELGVKYILEGSVIRSGAHVRVTAQLIQASDQAQLWAYEYDRDLRDILEVQAEVARAVARAIQVQLRPEAQRRLSQPRPTKPDAYEAYLKGRYFWWKRNAQAYDRARSYFQEAVRIDPNYAAAYAGLADTYFGAETCKLMAGKALELDDTLAEAHTSLAFCLWQSDADWAGAESHFQRALELDPYYPTARHWYGYMLAFWGRSDESINQLMRAREIDPLNVVINTDLGQVFYWAGRQDQAIEQLKKALEIDSTFDWAHYWLGRAYEAKGLWELAIAEYELARDAPDSQMDKNTALAHLYARLGQRERALQLLRDLERNRNALPTNRAAIYAALGDNDRSLDVLQEAARHHNAELIGARVDPWFGALRSTQRFRDLVGRVSPPHP